MADTCAKRAHNLASCIAHGTLEVQRNHHSGPKVLEHRPYQVTQTLTECYSKTHFFALILDCEKPNKPNCVSDQTHLELYILKKMVRPMGRRLPPLPSVRDILRMYNIQAKKALSQNFILDPRILDSIARHASM